MSKKIKISETTSKDPGKTKRITAFLLLFFIVVGIFFAIQKFGIEFFTFFIFILLLIIPIIILFETDIANSLGMSDKKLTENNTKLNKNIDIDKIKDNTPSITKKSYKYFIVAIICIALILTLVLISQSYKLEKGMSDFTKLFIGNIILINCGALISVTFN